MKCKDFDELLHLYLDGELKEKESKKIEEHLLACQRCSEKLQELKSLEEKAKGIKIAEPSAIYWKTFTQEVRNKIILRKKKPFWAKFRSSWESFFIYSPSKLKIAAGIASVLLVFIIGKLYWDYQGKDLERIRSERMEKALSSQAPQKVEFQAPMVKDTTIVESQPEEPTFAESVSIIPEEKVEKKITEELKRGKISAPDSTKEFPKVETKPSEQVTSPTLVRKIDLEEIGGPPSLQETTLQVQKSSVEKSAIKMAVDQPIKPEKFGKGLYFISGTRYYKVDEVYIRALTEKDTSVTADTLKKVIASWKEYIEKNPESEWLAKGTDQLAISFQLLFLKTKEESLLQEGIELLNRYKEFIIDQKTKDELNKKIKDLDALKKK